MKTAAQVAEQPAAHPRVGKSRSQQRADATVAKAQAKRSCATSAIEVGNGCIFTGDALTVLPALEANIAQVIVADPPYYQVLDAAWDNEWRSPEDYLQWTLRWARACKRVLRDDGLLYVFGQLGKREHIWLHTCSLLAREMQFHDMLIWDRAVGYNKRRDSFTPQYEMILALRKCGDAKVYFDKDAVRIPYNEKQIAAYLGDKRYKDKRARGAFAQGQIRDQHFARAVVEGRDQGEGRTRRKNRWR